MTISIDAVRWGYRFFLGREPESDDAIRAHIGAKNELHLAQVLMSSPEFAPRSPLFRPKPQQVPELGRIEVEIAATSTEMVACLAKIKASWSHLGETAPHFSVLTNEQFTPGRLTETIGDFWTSGQEEADQVIRTLKRHQLSGLAGKTCVEFGCGVGRVTTGLSRRFRRVDAYDISAAHLKLARERAAEVGVTNARFHECSVDILAQFERCDVFYSRIVLQHNPPPIIAGLIRSALLALRPAGIAVFQVPSYISGYRFRLREWLNTDHALDMQMHCLPQSHIFRLIAECGCEVLEVREDSSAGAADRIISNVFVVRKE